MSLLRLSVGIEAVDDLVGDLLNDLALVLHDQARLEEAEALYRRSLAIAREVHGGTHPAVASTLNNLAVLLHDQGDLAGAEELHRRSLDLRRRLYGDRHPAVALAAYNVARLAHKQGRLDEAEALYREALSTSRDVLGAHRYTTYPLRHLARLRAERGDPAEAETLLRECLEIQAQIEGPESAAVASLLGDLAEVLEDQGRLEAAAAAYRRSIELIRRQPESADGWAATSEVRLARVLLRQGDGPGAEQRVLHALPRLRSLLPGTELEQRFQYWQSMVAEAESVLWAVRLRRGEPEARARLQRSLEVLRAAASADDRAIFFLRAELAGGGSENGR